MIVAIEGEVVKKEPTFLHLKLTNGLTYLVHISINSSAQISTAKISLHATQIIKEDSHALYGFVDILEKSMFDRVIKINGVGPSTALAICSTFTPEAFSHAVMGQDVNALKAVPGIGPKSAKRILVELGDFTLISDDDGAGQVKQDALLALESLGFKKEAINKALRDTESTTTEALIKEALKKLT
ncbi:MAG: Holliday junction branch migration protein RuvA [Epsilonproteobacteria bacterium]|nr:Holliday junction branch migration protein RuvA [Campylobacterota bacterium]